MGGKQVRRMVPAKHYSQLTLRPAMLLDASSSAVASACVRVARSPPLVPDVAVWGAAGVAGSAKGAKAPTAAPPPTNCGAAGAACCCGAGRLAASCAS
jgi:hypothetical protein